MLKKFGLKDEDKFVCFDVRDGAYQLKKISTRYPDGGTNFLINSIYLSYKKINKNNNKKKVFLILLEANIYYYQQENFGAN